MYGLAQLATELGTFTGRSYDKSLIEVLGVPDVDGKDFYTCVIPDRLDDETFGLSKIATDIAAALVDTSSAGVVLGTKVSTFKRLVGEKQIAETTEELNVVAGTLDLLTGTTQAVWLRALSCKMPAEAAGGSVESISLVTDDETPTVFLESADALVGALTSEAEFVWEGKCRINTGTKLQLILAGGAHGSTYPVTITAEYEAIADGGYLAVSA